MLTQQEALLAHLGLFARALDVLLAKRHDYSGDVDPFANFRKASLFGVHPVLGLLLRVTDKMSRIANFVELGVLRVKGENVLDAVADNINYMGICGGLLVEEMTPEVLEVLTRDANRLSQLTDDLLNFCSTSRVQKSEGPQSSETVDLRTGSST